jgi:hypothetical protein
MKRPQYELQENGTPIGIIWRKKGQMETNRCPFCKRKHRHGISEGGRVPQCTNIVTRKGTFKREDLFFIANDGTLVQQQLIYIIKHY